MKIYQFIIKVNILKIIFIMHTLCFIIFDSIYVDMKYNDNNSYYFINMIPALIITNYGIIIAPHELINYILMN